MIETYELENLTGTVANIFTNIMRDGFIIAVILLVIWILVSIFIWRFGANKKSEKSIKFGIRNIIISVVALLIILMIPIILK